MKQPTYSNGRRVRHNIQVLPYEKSLIDEAYNLDREMSKLYQAGYRSKGTFIADLAANYLEEMKLSLARDVNEDVKSD